MNWMWLEIEILVLVNVVILLALFTIATTLVVDIAAKRLAIGASFFWTTYFEAKKKHLEALMKAGISEGSISSFN